MIKKLLLFTACLVLLSIVPSAYAQSWSSAGLSYPGLVFALSEYGGVVNGGGIFSAPEQVRAMAVYNGALYSGGVNIGGVTHVFSNGNSVGAISGGGPITSMAVFNNELYVGGLFDSINGIFVNNIAKWNGSAWSAVSGGIGGMSDFVYALGVYNSALYAGTNFGPCYKWNGTSWTTAGNFTSVVGGGTLIRGFGVYNGELYAGGFFDHVDGNAMVNLARWNGTNWAGVGDIGVAGDPSDGLSALLEYSGALYCAGNFSTAGGIAAENIARFSNGGFQPLGTGTNGVVNALLVFNQSLYAAGNFNTAGGISVSNIAKWTICTPPSASISYTGAPVLCNPGGSLLLNANTGTGLTWQWKNGGSTISGATLSSYLVTAIGTYSVVVTNASGCSAISSDVGVSANTVFASITPSGSVAVCSGANALLTAYTNAGYSYQWKKNGTNISGATSSTYNASVAGSYTVDETIGICTKTSNTVTVTVNPLPSVTITPAGPTTFCSGGSVVLNAVVAANRTYQWKKGVNLISGATLSSYTATSGGNYKVIVTNTITGCSKTTGSATVVTVNALPTATITPQGPTTFCAGGSVVLAANTGAGLTYKWKKGTNFISGATLSNYTATIGGTYKVQVTNSNGCSKTSAGVVVSVPCREGEITSLKNNLDFSVYPNPNSGEFTIKFSNLPTSPIQIELTDELGKVVKRFETNDETVVIKEPNLAKGVYCLTARNKNQGVLKKISIVQ